MKKYIQIIFVTGLLTAISATAQEHSISKGFVILNPGGAGNTFYDTDVPTANPDWTGTVATIHQGTSLHIGGEVTTTRPGVAADSARIFYSVNGAASQFVDLPLLSSGSVDVWQEGSLPNMDDIGSALAVGIHTVEVYFTATDANHPVAPGLTKRLPAVGAYTAQVEVITAPPTPVILTACDMADDPAYDSGWTDGSNGGTGFGPWMFFTNQVGDGDATGFFTAVNDPGLADNDDLNGIGSGTPPEAWGIFANEGSTGGDDIQIAGAFRALPEVMQSGSVFRVKIEHGSIQSGSLDANFPPRTGGWVGFTLRSQAAPLFGDPDPISAFATIQNAQIGFGFEGGQLNYKLYDVINTSGLDTGIPFTSDGVEVSIHLTSTNTYDVTIRQLGEGGIESTIKNRSISGSIAHVGLYNRNAENDNAYFNMMKVEEYLPIPTNKAAMDNAGLPEYDAGWTNGANGGSGFDPWLITVFDDGGAAGAFLATNPPNTDLNFITSNGRGWGTFANDGGVGGIQNVTAFRSFSQGDLLPGQTISAQFEHGDISGINGSVRVVLVGTPTFPNPMGEIFTLRFVGGASEYDFFDGSFGAKSTGIPFTTDGIQMDFSLVGLSAPYDFELRLTTLGDNVTRVYTGVVDSPPRQIKFITRDVELADVFYNNLCISQWVHDLLDLDGDQIPNDYEVANGLNPHVNDANGNLDGDEASNLDEYIADTLANDSNSVFALDILDTASLSDVVFDSSTNRLYTLEYRDSLLTGSWIKAPHATQVMGTGAGDMLIDTNDLPQRRYYRIGVELP